MNGEEAVGVLQSKTSLEVAPHSVLAAIASQPGDIEAAVKQVIDWWASGEARSKKAGTLLLAALRSQTRSQPSSEERRARGRASWDDKVAEAKRLVPGEHPPFAAMAVQVLRFGGQRVTPESVRAKLVAEGRDMKSLLRKAAAEERANEVGA